MSSKKKFDKRGRPHGQKAKLVRRKPAKHTCGICGKEMQGMPHCRTRSKTRKLSKTERRPSAPFGGVLCTECRTIVAEEAAKTLSGKKISETDLRYKSFVEKTLKRL